MSISLSTKYCIIRHMCYKTTVTRTFNLMPSRSLLLLSFTLNGSTNGRKRKTNGRNEKQNLPKSAAK